MKRNYKFCIDRIIDKYEGGYSNDPGDPGGPTKYGITYIDYAEFLHRPRSQVTAAMVRGMSLETAESIYAQKYERGSRFDELPDGVDLCVIDYAINSGLGRPPRVIQHILGIPVTGKSDDATINAIAHTDPEKLIDAICDERLAFLKRLGTWGTFGRGWAARVKDVRSTSKVIMRRSGEAADNIPSQTKPETMGKGTHIDPRQQEAVIKTATGGGAAATGGAATAAAIQSHVGLYIACGVLGVVVIGGVYFYYQIGKQQKKLQDTVILPQVPSLPQSSIPIIGSSQGSVNPIQAAADAVAATPEPFSHLHDEHGPSAPGGNKS